MTERAWSFGLVVAVVLVAVLSVVALLVAESDLFFALPGVTAAVVGALILSKRPGNGIGVFLLACGVLAAVFGFSSGYAAASATAGEPFPAEGFVTWIASWTWSPFLVAFPALLFIYPSGRPVGVWRWVAAVLGSIWLVGMAIFLSRLTRIPTETLQTLILDPEATDAVYDDAQGIPSMVLLVGLPAGLAAIAHRWLRGTRVERQQIKWLVAAAVVLVGGLLVSEFLLRGSAAGDWLWIMGLTAFPVAVSIAILRHNLFDIDRIINRTVVYALIVALLGAVFIAGAVWLPSLLPFEDNSLAVAASTLAVLLLFNPLRVRVQRFVDRRFYRSRYDAQQVAEEFSARLRDQVDPEAVASEWVEVVRRTLQPESVGVWVRSE